MVGIVAGGLMGGPIGTYLLGRHPRRACPRAPAGGTLENLAERADATSRRATPAGEDVEAYALLKHLVVMLVAVGAGAWVSAGIAAIGLDAAGLHRRDDRRRGHPQRRRRRPGVIGISQRTIDDLGTVALSLFLVMALMTLRLWELAGAVVPLLVILACQVALVAALCLFVVPRLMGRDYDAVVMSSGFCGFMLGTTANAVANMGALVERYGPAPKAYLVVPLVGAFGIDFVNALLITAALNFWRRMPYRRRAGVSRPSNRTATLIQSFGSSVVLIVPLACSNLYWFRSIFGLVGTLQHDVDHFARLQRLAVAERLRAGHRVARLVVPELVDLQAGDRRRSPGS